MIEWVLIIILGVVVSPVLIGILFLICSLFIGVVAYVAELWFRFCTDLFHIIDQIFKRLTK